MDMIGNCNEKQTVPWKMTPTGYEAIIPQGLRMRRMRCLAPVEFG